jgi:hypothetical protein
VQSYKYIPKVGAKNMRNHLKCTPKPKVWAKKESFCLKEGAKQNNLG